MTIWDIAPTVSPDAPIFPGDEPYAVRETAALGPGCPVNLTALTLSPHIGAHVDAPFHFSADGADVASLPLEPFLGVCRVVHLIADVPDRLVTPADLEAALGDVSGIPARILVRTRHEALTVWRNDFAAFDAEAIRWLAARGVTLVGIDTPSVDPAESKDLPAHQALRETGIVNLENLVLDAVPAGDYELIALPLKLAGACASPVRAILRTLP
ncbi:MAG TPA: arylformamidase [Dermatophilaceae bacterium]|nr:arylformamidase [Dermatophilaceae bacterium]